MPFRIISLVIAVVVFADRKVMAQEQSVTTAAVDRAEPSSEQEKKDVEKIVADYLKKESEKKKLDAETKRNDDLFGGTRFELQSLYDSLHEPSAEPKKWYDKIRIRGYTQFRFGRTLETETGTPNLFGDRTINATRKTF